MTVYANRVPGTAAFRLYGTDDACAQANSFLETWEAKGLSAHTIRAYAFDLVLLLRWLNESGKPLAQLDTLDLVDFIESARGSGAQPTSINRRLTVFGLFYRFITGSDLDGHNARVAPAGHYKGRGRDRDLGLHQLHRRPHKKLRVKAPRKLVEPLDPRQVVLFMQTLRRYRDLAIVTLMLFCGLRTKEVIAMERSDVNLLDGQLRIRGKGNVERSLPLPRNLVGVLADYHRLERPKTDFEHIFVVLQGPARGQPMTLSGIRSLFRSRRTRSPDVANANPHRFRHTFGADMARAGVQLPVLQKMMGHAAPETTLRYVNLSMADIAEEYCRVAESIRLRYEAP
ncbi:MAG: tyrosine-type recombinase/integrase [Myxococcales bacterium]|nr:tyrosine-type recombinase/integrase [Myxococcales bacterium]